MPNLARTLLQAVRAHGAREIFGIPGDFALPFCREIEDSAILPLYTHEPAIGFAADAASRFRASISVAAVTWGAGALNLVNATAGAYAERVPVVVVSGALARASAAPAGSCTTWPARSTPNCAFFARSPAPRRCWTIRRPPQAKSPACCAQPPTTRDRST
jgi:hypothetical protein